MSVRLSTPVPQVWDELLRNSGVPFRFSQTSAAVHGLASARPGYLARAYRVQTDEGDDVLLPTVRVPRRFRALSLLEAMPLSWQGSPLVLSGTVTERALRGVVRGVPDVGALRVTGGPLAGGTDVADTLSALVDGHSETHLLDLRPGFEALWESGFAGKNRNVCRKAEKAGIQVGREAPAEALGAYFPLYVEATRHWGYAEPPYSRALFAALMAAPGVEFVLARLEGRVVAGTVSLLGSHDAFQWTTVMDRSVSSLSPTNALLKWVIEDACQRGLDWYDMGSSAGLPGVASFKESFGARRVTFPNLTVRSTLNQVLEGVVGITRGRDRGE